MTTITMPRSRGFAAVSRPGALAVLRGLYARIARYYRIRRDRQVLQSMPDYRLSDLVISRSEIEAATEFGRSRVATW